MDGYARAWRKALGVGGAGKFLNRSIRQLKTFVVICAVLALGWSSTASSQGLDYFRAVERCDAAGKVKEKYRKQSRLIAVDTPCWSGHEIPKAALSQAAELRVYAYDLGECEFQPRFDTSRKDLMPAGGMVLTSEVRKEIESLLPIAVWEQGVSMCFEPHHALAWFDKSGKAIASAEICFSCTGFELKLGAHTRSSNDQLNYAMIDVDFVQLHKTFRRIGVPMNLKQACSESATGVWAESVTALCELDRKRRKHIERQPREFHAKRCVQLPNHIQF